MKFVAAVALMVGASTAFASARTLSAGVFVSATVRPNCVVRSDKQLNFGIYGPENAHGKALLHQNHVLLIACNRGALGVEISLNNGDHFSHGHRRMRAKHGDAAVDYQVYTSGRRNEVWNEKHTIAYVPKTDQPMPITAFGKVPGGQHLPAGEYSDTLTATVNF